MKSEKMREEFEKYVSNQGVSLDYQGDGVYGNIKVRRWYEGALIAHEILDIENKILRNALEKLACLGNGEKHGNSVGNLIAIEALEKTK